MSMYASSPTRSVTGHTEVSTERSALTRPHRIRTNGGRCAPPFRSLTKRLLCQGRDPGRAINKAE